MQHDSSMAISVSYPVRRSPCCVKRNVRYGSQGTHRDNMSHQLTCNTEYHINCPMTMFFLNNIGAQQCMQTNLKMDTHTKQYTETFIDPRPL